MIKDKKILFLLLATFAELAVIVVLAILNMQKASAEMAETVDDYDSIDEYCQNYNDEICDEYKYDDAEFFSNVYVDEEVFGDVFRQTYADIIKGAPVPADYFSSFSILSEYYDDAVGGTIITGENSPLKYTASSYRISTNSLAYPYNVLRQISIDIENEGCATFDFSPDFTLLQHYYLEEGSCDELGE